MAARRSAQQLPREDGLETRNQRVGNDTTFYMASMLNHKILQGKIVMSCAQRWEAALLLGVRRDRLHRLLLLARSAAWSHRRCILQSLLSGQPP